jgi:hypothetical protein
MASRREALIEIFGRSLPNAEGQKDGPLEFSLPVPYGDPQVSCETVMMTRIEDKDGVFVPDILRRFFTPLACLFYFAHRLVLF